MQEAREATSSLCQVSPAPWPDHPHHPLSYRRSLLDDEFLSQSPGLTALPTSGGRGLRLLVCELWVQVHRVE